ncbi:MAG: DinB family protein [Acidobacteria bacterium]|nr:DinB family protein [Acidobacteriota bacterium]
MKETADEIRTIVTNSTGSLSSLSANEVSFKASPDKWSKKEILGHLIDSAANNHHRFVRAGYNAAADFPPYSQIDWVRIQKYNESEWNDLIALWSACNLHLCHVIERLPEDALSAPCNIGKEEPVLLEFVIKDYLRHLRHHMEVILGE